MIGRMSDFEKSARISLFKSLQRGFRGGLEDLISKKSARISLFKSPPGEGI